MENAETQTQVRVTLLLCLARGWSAPYPRDYRSRACAWPGGHSEGGEDDGGGGVRRARWCHLLTSDIKPLPLAIYPQSAKARMQHRDVVEVDHDSGLLGYSRGECRLNCQAARSGRRTRRWPGAHGQWSPREGGVLLGGQTSYSATLNAARPAPAELPGRGGRPLPRLWTRWPGGEGLRAASPTE